MHFSLKLLVFFVLACLFSSAFAAVEGFPSEIQVFGEPVKVDFSVSNPTASEKALNIQLFAPVDVNIVAPSTIKANKAVNVSIIILPKKEFVGQSYDSVLIVKLLGEETRKNVKIVFNAPKQIAPIDTNVSNFTGRVSLFAKENELAIDIVLAIIVIILLIAFIARLVKRFG